MHFFKAFVGFLLVATVCQAAVVQKRTYRNNEEILVPVAVIEDGEEFKEQDKLQQQEAQPEAIKNLETDTSNAASEEEKKLESVEAVVEAQRRFDEEIVEEEIKEAIEEEQNKELIKALEAEKQSEAVKDSLAQESENQAEYKKVPVIEKQTPTKVFVIVQTNNEAEKPAQSAQPEQPAQPAQPELPAQPETAAQPEPAAQPESAAQPAQPELPAQPETAAQPEPAAQPESAAQPEQQSEEQPADPEGTLRQATQATPSQTTTQQNFVQQLIQNSPLGQFFNQITGQNAQNQVANDDASPGSPAPTLPGLFNPVTAVQTAAQTVVNSTSQAFAGLQQFASNLGNQFQSTLSGLTGQQVEQSDATTARPPGPIQQLVSTFIGGNAQQPAPTQQGPLQGFLNIFQGNRPQASTAAANDEIQPAKEPSAAEQINENDAQAAVQPDVLSNEVRDSAEANDSFEQSVQPDEIIVVNDDASQTSEQKEQDSENVTQ